MKFILTESKIEQVIFKYLDNQDFVKVEKGEYIYLVNSLDDEFAQIKYNKNNGWCYIHHDLVQEISSFFSLDPFDSKKIIGKWVENTLQMKVSNICKFVIKSFLVVENTLQMKVSNTFSCSAGWCRMG